MSCPLFLPATPLGDFAGHSMPLGDVYGGTCAALPGAAIEDDKIRRFCNMGYARDSCEQARNSAADAARFLVTADRGAAVEVAWSLERDHHPVGVGTVEIRVDCEGAARGRMELAIELPLEIQARACAASYLRRVGRA
jgi:hypothetical protein